MNLLYLKSFYTTAECKSISKAAKKLHMTQPGLSMQLQALETELGKTLFERSHRGVILTKEGEVVAKHTKQILNLEAKMFDELEQLDAKQKEIILGACSDLANYALPCSIYTFKQIHDDMLVNVLSTDSNDIIKKIRNNELNMGIVHGFNEIDDMEQITLMKTKILLVGHADSELSNLKISDLKSLDFVKNSGNISLNNEVEITLNSHNLSMSDLKTNMDLDSYEAIKTSLMHLDAYAFIPEMMIKHELRDQFLKKINVKDFNIEYEYILVYRKGYEINEHERAFIDFITSSHRCFCY